MSFIEINFGQDAQAKLGSLGLNFMPLRGVYHVNEGSWFEPPCHIYSRFADWTEFRIGAFSILQSGRIGNLHMGRYCSVAPDVIIGANEHPVDWLGTTRLTYQPGIYDFHRIAGAPDLKELDRKKRPFPTSWKVTTVGNDVWIGMGAFVKAGITIGDGAVIGAKSVVVKDVPPYSIVAGSPAKVRKYRFPDGIIERLMALQWWRFSIFDLYGVPFENIEAALDQIEEMVGRDALKAYTPAPVTASALKSALTPA